VNHINLLGERLAREAPQEPLIKVNLSIIYLEVIIMKTKRSLCLILFMALSLIPVGKAFTLPPRESLESFQCSGGTASLGDTKANIIAKCGEPASIEKSSDGMGEQWTYDLDPTKSIYYYLEFKNGVLEKIESGESGGGK
jgi:hypothetical protein